MSLNYHLVFSKAKLMINTVWLIGKTYLFDQNHKLFANILLFITNEAIFYGLNEKLLHIKISFIYLLWSCWGIVLNFWWNLYGIVPFISDLIQWAYVGTNCITMHAWNMLKSGTDVELMAKQFIIWCKSKCCWNLWRFLKLKNCWTIILWFKENLINEIIFNNSSQFSLKFLIYSSNSDWKIMIIILKNVIPFICVHILIHFLPGKSCRPILMSEPQANYWQ